MESRAKLAGHPIHPMLIVFPLGLFSTAVIFDVLGLISGNAYWYEISYWMIVSGLIGGAAAAVFGTIDWLAIPRGTRAFDIGLLHGAGNAVVVLLFFSSAIMRTGTVTPSTWAHILSFAGVLLALVTGWLGGELVDRLGVGVDDGANLNSPSSLSGHPANQDLRAEEKRRAF